MPGSVLRTLGALTHEILTLATIYFIGTEIVSNFPSHITNKWQGQD